MRKAHLLFVTATMLVALVSAAAEKIDSATQKLRDEFGLARLLFLKQVAKDAELDSSTRDALVKVCDDTRDDLLAAVDQEKNQPSEEEDRKQTIADLSQKFTDNCTNAIHADRTAEQAINKQVARLTYELELIRKEQLLDKMGDLDLSEEQKSAIDGIVSDTKKKVKASTADAVMKDEQAMTALLDARKKINDKLEDDQKTQWKKYVADHANEKRTPAGFNSRP